MKFWIKFLNNANRVTLSGVKLGNLHIALFKKSNAME
jgi:hypothetical protein